MGHWCTKLNGCAREQLVQSLFGLSRRGSREEAHVKLVGFRLCRKPVWKTRFVNRVCVLQRNTHSAVVGGNTVCFAVARLAVGNRRKRVRKSAWRRRMQRFPFHHGIFHRIKHISFCSVGANTDPRLRRRVWERKKRFAVPEDILRQRPE
jgi:hypothetical protein